MKLSLIHYDGCVIQLQFAFRRSLRNGVPLHGEVLYCRLFWRREPLNFTAWCRQRRFDFSGPSPYKNHHHSCEYFSFVRFPSVAWLYNYYTPIFLVLISQFMTDHATPLQVTEVQSSLPHVHKHILIGCQFTFEITDGLSWTLLR